MKVKVKKGDVIWNYLSIVSSLGSNIVIVPFVMYYLSGEMLGLWYVFCSVGGIASLFDFGFTVTFSRNITYCWSGAKSYKKIGGVQEVSKEPDFKMMNVILFVCRKVYMIIAIVILILMLSLGSLYIYNISSHLDYNVTLSAWVLYSIGVFLNMYYNYYDSFLRGVGAVEKASKSRTIAKLSQIFLMAILLVCGCGIIGISIAYILFGCLFRLLCKYAFYRHEGLKDKLLSRVSSLSFQKRTGLALFEMLI